MASKSGAGTYPDPSFEHAVGTDFDVVGKLYLSVNDGRGVDPGHGGRSGSLGTSDVLPSDSAYRTPMTDPLPPIQPEKGPPGVARGGLGGPGWLNVRDLGRVGYAEALVIQKRLQAEVIATRGGGAEAGYVLLLEHDPPVITVTRRPGAAAHVLADERMLARHGVERHETDRGGDVTYHGPGQLVVYPIVDLERLGIRIHEWIRLLEQAIIDTLGDFGVAADRDPGATGVWVGRGSDAVDGQGGRKIAAIGVRVSRWVTMHGLALNVDPDLGHFDLIVPCGLAGRPVTSIACERDGDAPSIRQVGDLLAGHLAVAMKRLQAGEG